MLKSWAWWFGTISDCWRAMVKRKREGNIVPVPNCNSFNIKLCTAKLNTVFHQKYKTRNYSLPFGKIQILQFSFGKSAIIKIEIWTLQSVLISILVQFFQFLKTRWNLKNLPFSLKTKCRSKKSNPYLTWVHYFSSPYLTH